MTLSTLGDEDYRRLLKAKVLANSWDGTAAGAQAILQSFVVTPGAKIFVEDRGHLKSLTCVSGATPSIVELEIIKQDLIPLKAQGVEKKVLVTSVSNTPLFGWGVNNDLIGGWGHGSWGVSPDFIEQNAT